MTGCRLDLVIELMWTLSQLYCLDYIHVVRLYRLYNFLLGSAPKKTLGISIRHNKYPTLIIAPHLNLHQLQQAYIYTQFKLD